ncbi:Glycine rich protein [compost metagenome]
MEVVKNEYSYEPNVQEYIVQATGYYKIEAWGASGGYGYGNINPYGLGAYVVGNVYLEKGQKLYIYSGEKGKDQTATTSFNGGGAGFYGSLVHKGGQGGGATDIRLVNGNWDDSSGLQKRILVAGGGRRWSIYLWRNCNNCRKWWNISRC